MPRLPIDIETKLSVRVHRGRQAIWEIVRELGLKAEPFTRSDINRRFPNRSGDVVRYLGCLEQAKIIVSDHASVYRLIRDVGPEAPRLRSDGSPAQLPLGQEQMWRVMHMAPGGFTPKDLAITASTEDVLVKLSTAKAYIGHLFHAGYLDLLIPSRPGVQATYALKRSMRTGPRAPMVQRIKAVWDPNLRRHVGQIEINEDEHHEP